MKFYQALAKAFRDNGVDIIFGLAGDANLYAMDSFVRDQRGEFIGASHESSAVLMALGYATLSGKLGVASVTHGPGLTNCVTALVEGVKGQVPMVLFCGDTAADERHHSQRVAQREVVLSTGAGFEQLKSPHTLALDLATAIRRAWTERRPIALNIPADFQWVEVDYQPLVLTMPKATGSVPTDETLDNAVGIIASAKRPIILAGRGVLTAGARDAIVRLAKRLDAPLATTLKSQHMFDGEFCNIGVLGTVSTPPATDVVMASDCIIAFGAGLNIYTSAKGSFFEGRRVVQINAEPGEVGKLMQPDLAVVGDYAATADLIVHWLDEAEIEPSAFATVEMDESLRSYRPETEFQRTDTPAGTVDIRQALWRIARTVPDDRIVVNDGGRFCGASYKLVTAPRPGSFLFAIHSGSIGLGIPHAIGAGCADRSRPLLCVAGDGGFMLGGLVEFTTAVREKLDLILVICNDGAYGAEHIQFCNKGMDPALSVLKWPDFAPVADALGGKGLTVRSDAELEAALNAIETRDRSTPLLIDLKLDPNHIPPAR